MKNLYYPVQLPDILNDEFKKNTSYKEYELPEFADMIMCVWSMRSANLKKPVINKILPDACVDIVIDFTDKIAVFAAFSKATEDFEVSGKIDYVGIRFKPGVFNCLYKISSDKITDTSVHVDKIETEYDFTKILKIKNTYWRLEFLKKYLSEKKKKFVSTKLMKLLPEVYLSPTNQKIYELFCKMNYSARHLNRVFYREIGVNPKTFLNIVRLHKSLNILKNNPKANLSDLAFESGFFDQAHFIKEIKRYCGISPLQIAKRIRVC